MTDDVLAEFKAYWSLSEELVAKASKEQLAYAARLLALRAAEYTRRFGELEQGHLFELLSATNLDPDKLQLLRDGTEAFVGVLAIVTDGLEDEPDAPMQ